MLAAVLQQIHRKQSLARLDLGQVQAMQKSGQRRRQVLQLHLEVEVERLRPIMAEQQHPELAQMAWLSSDGRWNREICGSD